jgi:putative tricarboxylic transport membrane protein
VLLLGLGAVVLWDTATLPELPSAENQPIGPRAVPTAVGIGLVVCAVLHAVDVLRGGRGEMEGGEDIDPDAKLDYKAVGLLVAVFLANALLIEPLGWAISGALLFWGAAFALGSRHFLRDACIAATLSVGSFYAFYYGLGITLPPGVLKGIL